MLKVLAGHQIGGSGHVAHHDLLRLHEIKRTLLYDCGLLAEGDGDLERVGDVAVSHGGPRPGCQVGGPAGVGRALGGESFHASYQMVMYQTVNKRYRMNISQSSRTIKNSSIHFITITCQSSVTSRAPVVAVDINVLVSLNLRDNVRLESERVSGDLLGV